MRSSTFLVYPFWIAACFALCSFSVRAEIPSNDFLSIQQESNNPEDTAVVTVSNKCQFTRIIKKISKDTNALFVFDIDNTLLITNDNKFGSDWWYSQTKKHPDLKLNVDAPCLFGVLTPMFYATLPTKPVFPKQPEVLERLEAEGNKTIALTSRGYTPVVAPATELELRNNDFDFLDDDSLGLENNVVMLHGVIYTGGKDKGVALLEYLETHPYTNIYYFDDSDYKVENVKKAFYAAGKPVSLYHLTIAPKIPYTDEEMEYMKEKLCIVIQAINSTGETDCKCKNP